MCACVHACVRACSPIPRSQDWACGPSAFLYGYCTLKDCLLGYFSRNFVVMWWIVFFKENRIYFSKPMRLSGFLNGFLLDCFEHVFF